MSYRKGEDTPAKKRRRLPFKAVVEEREEPFLAADLGGLEAECRRVTNGAEFLYSMEHNGDRYQHVVPIEQYRLFCCEFCALDKPTDGQDRR